MSELPHLAITAGEPAGIGPDLCLFLSQSPLPCRLTVLGDCHVLEERATRLGISVTLHEGEATGPQQKGRLNVLPLPVANRVIPGRLDPANAPHVLSMIDTATKGCLSGRFDALVTTPVHKGVINETGIAFSGHTEYIAALTGGQPVMMLVSRFPRSPVSQSDTTRQSSEPAPVLRVALATTHLPLREVPTAVSRQKLKAIIEVLHRDLRDRFALGQPRITVLGLNPHAGEGGHLGKEEIEVIQPVMEDLRQQGMTLTGPLPADTAFLPHILSITDAHLAMYHDQGLPVLKYAGFGRAVNITLGLPIIRTSVDHGTALELAGSGNIDHGSLLEAITTAIELACHDSA